MSNTEIFNEVYQAPAGSSVMTIENTRNSMVNAAMVALSTALQDDRAPGRKIRLTMTLVTTDNPDNVIDLL